MAATDTLTEPAPPPPAPRLGDGPRPPGRVADRLFRWAALLAASVVLAILALIAISTTRQAWPWFRAEGLGAVFSNDWDPAAGHFGAAALLWGTLVVGAIALVLAVPVSIGIALFVTDVAPRFARRPIVYTVDLLAAIPSVVFGLWVLKALTKPLADLYASVSDATSGVPLLSRLFADPSASGQALMTGGIVVAIMITPIITAITREVFATCPASQKEAALALGATRWEMIRGSVFPHARSGMVAAVVIGFGRAVGETIAVALVVGASPNFSLKILAPGDTMASIIANQFGEASGTFRSALIGLGVVLFGMTLVLGMAARTIVTRAERRHGAPA